MDLKSAGYRLQLDAGKLIEAFIGDAHAAGCPEREAAIVATDVMQYLAAWTAHQTTPLGAMASFVGSAATHYADAVANSVLEA